MSEPLSDAEAVVNTVVRCFSDGRVPLELATAKGTNWFARRIAHAVVEEVMGSNIFTEDQRPGLANQGAYATRRDVHDLADDIMRGDPDAWWK